MKKVLSLFLILTLILSSIVLAQDNAQTTVTIPTILPDENLKYTFLVLLPEKVSLWTTFNPRDKALKRLEAVQKRDLEIYALTQKYDPTKYDLDKLIAKNQARKERLLIDVEESLNDLSTEDAKIVTDNFQKHIDVLRGVLAKAPESAKPALTRVIEKAEIKKEEIKAVKDRIYDKRNPTTSSTSSSTSTTSTTALGETTSTTGSTTETSTTIGV